MGKSLVSAQGMADGKLLHSEITKIIIAVFFEVYNELGAGFLEHVYRVAMVIALRARGLQVEVNPKLPVYFQGRLIAQFCPDLLVNGVVIVELKATRTIEGAHQAQLLNYLKASDVEVGLLLNFGGESAQFMRRVFENDRKAARKGPIEVEA
jgi:GxxExxY protein